ncbi:hypothetical protein WDW37_08950 [Bdellovibrionota bacterium FG-1]
MSGSVQNDGWTQKPTLKSNGTLAILTLIVMAFTGFKLRPYLIHAPTVHAYNGTEQTQQRHADEAVKKDGSFSLVSSMAALRQLKLGTGARSSFHPHVKVIERPLMDGLTVTISATLSRGVSSLEPDPSIEAVLGGLIRAEETRELDDSPLQGAKLVGMAVPNMDLKRMVLRFSELITRDGRSYAIQATAIDSETQTQGVAAEYSSGLGSRLAGVGISRVLTAGDQILMAKLLPDSGSASVAQQASHEAARQMNDQAANDISLETTRNLRETKAELSLAAGTPLTLRLRALPEQTQRSDSSN